MKTNITWGAIFDWDGVIIDSAAYHRESWDRLSAETALKLNDTFFHRAFGMKNEVIIPELLGWTRDPAEVRAISKRKEELYREILREKGTKPIAGAKEWLDVLVDAGIPRIIASSTELPNIACAIEVMGLGGIFEQIVSAEDVNRGKPEPDVFLKAAQKLGLPPSRCVVFEDAHVGIEAARAAKIKVIAVTTTHPADTLDDADLVVRRLDELAIESVSRLLES